MSRYADYLLDEILNTANENSIIFNKKKYSNCKKKLSQIASNDRHEEFGLAKLIRMDDMNAMAELIAKHGLPEDESKIRLGESCASVSFLAKKEGDYALSDVCSVMAYAVLYGPFYSALSNKPISKRYDYRGVEKQFNANSFSRCAKKIVNSNICREENRISEVISNLPKVLDDSESIRFFEYKIRSLDITGIKTTYKDLMQLETGQLYNPNIKISKFRRVTERTER
jgi:hypothetical protein